MMDVYEKLVTSDVDLDDEEKRALLTWMGTVGKQWGIAAPELEEEAKKRGIDLGPAGKAVGEFVKQTFQDPMGAFGKALFKGLQPEGEEDILWDLE
jgi:hypothetical protein